MTKILGELKGAYWINVVILCVKKSIFNAKLKDNSPTLAQVKANVMFVYKYDEHKATCIVLYCMFIDCTWDCAKSYGLQHIYSSGLQ